MIHVRLQGRAGALRIDVELAAPGPLVLVGPNGSGKTSILLMVVGALAPEQGRVEVGGTVLLDTASGVDVPLERRRLGYVPQDYALFPHLTVRQNVGFGGGDPKRIAEVLAELKLESLADRRVTALSGGERQRVALARALCVQPRALLLDEPLAALDVHSRREVRAFLGAYLTQLAMPTLVVTHDPADAQTLGQTLAVIEAGRVTQCGTWTHLAENPATPFVAEFVGVSRGPGNGSN